MYRDEAMNKTDFFGIGAAVKGALNIYFQAARHTGRTTTLLESLNDGDRVYFANSRDRRYFKNKCMARGLNIECIDIPVKHPDRVFNHSTSQGRAVFDHQWVEEYYLHQIEKCQQDIAHLEKESSGFGEAHLETRRKAEEIMKWRT